MKVLMESQRLLAGRPLTEDSGDVPVYFNVTDFMKAPKGPMGIGGGSEDLLRDAYDEIRKKVHEMLKQELRKPVFKKRMEDLGLMLK